MGWGVWGVGWEGDWGHVIVDVWSLKTGFRDFEIQDYRFRYHRI